MPISTQTKEIEYSDYIIGFMDVLGFTDRVVKSKESRSLRAGIAELLKEFSDVVTERTLQFKAIPNFAPIRIRSFSDSIMISCPVVSEESFRLVLWVTCECFVRSITRGFFLRGALTVGSHYENEDSFFGPAFVRAHEIESSLAVWPRCVIDPATLGNASICGQGSWETKYEYVLKNNDGLPYLDYLGYSFSMAMTRLFKEYRETRENTKLDRPSQLFPAVMKLHKRVICNEIERVSKDQAKKTLLLSRYYPLSLYHNYCIKEFMSGKPRFLKSGSVKIGAETQNIMKEFDKIATELGIENNEAENFKERFIRGLAEQRENWESQLIDIKQVFEDAWNMESGLDNS